MNIQKVASTDASTFSLQHGDVVHSLLPMLLHAHVLQKLLHMDHYSN